MLRESAIFANEIAAQLGCRWVRLCAVWWRPGRVHVEAAIIVTKVRAFPASNSTLYYEQALGQMDFMLGAEALSIPIRLVELTADIATPFDAAFATYHARR